MRGKVKGIEDQSTKVPHKTRLPEKEKIKKIKVWK